MPCYAEKYEYNTGVFSVKFDQIGLIEMRNKADLNMVILEDDIQYVAYNRIALSIMDKGLYLLDGNFDLIRLYKGDGHVVGMDDQQRIVWYDYDDSPEITLLSTEGEILWTLPINNNCTVAPVKTMNGIYYIQRDCDEKNNSVTNWLTAVSESGSLLWDINVTPETDEKWYFTILDVGQKQVYLWGGEDDENYLLVVNEDGIYEQMWQFEKGYLQSHAVLNDSEGLLFFVETNETEYLSKYKSDGELVFRINWNGISIDHDSFECKKILLDEDQNIYLFGSEEGFSFRMIVTKYDKDGNELWTKVLAGDYYENDKLTDAQYCANREFYIIGQNDINDNHNSLKTEILKMDSDGTIHWKQIYFETGSVYTEPLATTLDENGDLFVAGTYSVEEEVIENVGGCGC